MTATLCAATFSNSYVLWLSKHCVMLRFVAVPFKGTVAPDQVGLKVVWLDTGQALMGRKTTDGKQNSKTFPRLFNFK